MFPFSPLKRNLWSYWKWQTFDVNIPYNFWEGDFFQEYIEMELKIFSKSVFFYIGRHNFFFKIMSASEM